MHSSYSTPTRYKMKRIRSKLGDVVKLLGLAIGVDRIYYGDTGAVTREHEALDKASKRRHLRGMNTVGLLQQGIPNRA